MSDSFYKSAPHEDAEPTLRERVERLLAPGTKVGDYVVEVPLGEGGFGTVYRASHPLIGKRAAIKVLNKDLSSDPEMVARFVAEARAVNTIRHQNIVDIFNIGTLDDGRHYFVMELLDGHSLEDLLSKNKRVPPADLLVIMRGVAGALQAAHDKGIVHRDLKPDNIFLHIEPNGVLTPKLVDFGVAKLTGEARSLSHHQTATGAPIGTPRYMSPEQCFAREIDSRTDIYALGVVCFEALTGEAPFDAESLLELMNKHTMAPRPNASSVYPPLGRTFDAPLVRMMAVDPLDRPATALEALRLLEEAATARAAQRGRNTPTDLAPMTTAALGSRPSAQAAVPPARRSEPQHTTPLFDTAVTLQKSSPGLAPAVTNPSSHALAARNPTTLGATSSGIYMPGHNASKRVVWLIAGALSVLVVSVALAIAFTGDAEPEVTPAGQVERDLAPATDDPSQAAVSATVEPPSPASAELPAAPIPEASAAPEPSASAKPVAPRTRRRPRPAPLAVPAAPKPKPDPYSFQ